MGGSVFWWPSTAFGWRRRRDGGMRARVLGDEVGVRAQAVAGSLDLHDDGVVEQPVEQRSGDDRVSKDLPPFGEAAVGGQDHGTLLIACVDQLEEEIGAAGRDRQVADLGRRKLKPAWWAPNGFAAIPTAALDPAHRPASPAVPALIGSGSPSFAIDPLIEVGGLCRRDLGDRLKLAQELGVVLRQVTNDRAFPSSLLT